MTKYFGKHRGKVLDNADPRKQGRVRVSCPDVLPPDAMSWAMPSVPYAGDGVGLFLVPPTGANVWVEFEAGDPGLPIWSGCFWDVGQTPGPGVAQTKVLKTDGLTLTVRDQRSGGGVTIEVGPPVLATSLTMVFDSGGIKLVNGSAKVALAGGAVSVNDGALEVR